MIKQYTALGRSIQKYRLRLGENITIAANSVGIDRSHLSKIESGDDRPSETVMLKLMSHFKLDKHEATELWREAHFGAPLIVQETRDKNIERRSAMDEKPTMEHEGKQVPVSLDLNQTPVLYSDAVLLTSDGQDFGLVLNFAQSAGNQMHIVARIGISLQHAQTLLETLNNHLAKTSRNTNK